MCRVDPDLVARAVAGDTAATGRLLYECESELSDFIRSRCSGFLLQRIDVDDIVSDVSVEVFKRIRKFELRHDGAFCAWLRAIANNRIVDRFRKEERRPDVAARQACPFQAAEDSCLNIFNEWASTLDTPSRALRRAERIEAVKIAISNMTYADQRRALELFHIKDKSYAEIAMEMGKTEDSVRGLLQRANKALKSLLGNASEYLSSR